MSANQKLAPMLTTRQTDDESRAAKARIEAAREGLRAVLDGLEDYAKDVLGKKSWAPEHSKKIDAIRDALRDLMRAEHERYAVYYQRCLRATVKRLGRYEGAEIKLDDIADDLTGENLGAQVWRSGGWSRTLRDGDVIIIDAEVVAFPLEGRWDFVSAWRARDTVKISRR